MISSLVFLVSSALARRHLWKSAKNFEKYFIYHKLRGHTSKATLKYTFCDGRHERGKKMLTKKCVNKSIYNRGESETKKTTTNPIQEKNRARNSRDQWNLETRRKQQVDEKVMFSFDVVRSQTHAWMVK